MSQVLWELYIPSTGLHRSPWLYAIPIRSCCLWWVAAKDEGGGRSEALVFTGVESYKQTQYHAYGEEIRHLTYDSLLDLGPTPLLGEIRSLVKDKTHAAELRHMAISFDGGPLFEFVASGFEFRSPFDVGLIESPIRERLEACVNPLEKPAH